MGSMASAVYQLDDHLVVSAVLQVVDLGGEHVKQGGFLPQFLSVWSKELN